MESNTIAKRRQAKARPAAITPERRLKIAARVADLARYKRHVLDVASTPDAYRQAVMWAAQMIDVSLFGAPEYGYPFRLDPQSERKVRELRRQVAVVVRGAQIMETDAIAQYEAELARLQDTRLQSFLSSVEAQ
jgi:hypothetical protein